MKKKFNYLKNGKNLFCYIGKNQVVELEFETEFEINDFILAIENYQKTGEIENENFIEFLEKNPEYAILESNKVFPFLFIKGGEDEISLITKIAHKRGFKNIITDEKDLKKEQKVIGLNIKTAESDFEKNTKFFCEQVIPFLTLDLNQGSYGVIGPFCVPKDLACPLCVETRFVANDLLYDFHQCAKNKNHEITEFFYDEIFKKQLITNAINELYFEVQYGRCNLRNQIRNYSFFTGETSTEGVLPFPECVCQKS